MNLTPDELERFVKWTNISLGSAGVLPVSFSFERDGTFIELTEQQVTQLHIDLNYIDVARYVKRNTEQLRVMIQEITADENRVKKP